MNWFAFIVITFVLLILELGLESLLSIYGWTPSFMLILAVFVALSAPKQTALWAAMIIGLLVDLASPLSHSQELVLIGPACIGFVAGAFITIELRGLLFRNSPIAPAVMVLGVGVLVHLIIVAVITSRGFVWSQFGVPLDWSLTQELVDRFFSLLYTALLAVPLGMGLVQLDPLWHFEHRDLSRRSRTRRLV